MEREEVSRLRAHGRNMGSRVVSGLARTHYEVLLGAN
jgi:hypothetical protein